MFFVLVGNILLFFIDYYDCNNFKNQKNQYFEVSALTSSNQFDPKLSVYQCKQYLLVCESNTSDTNWDLSDT